MLLANVFIYSGCFLLFPSESLVKSKWNQLKSQYRRELGRLSETCRAGSEAETPASRWWLFGLMDSFLRPHTTLRNGSTYMVRGKIVLVFTEGFSRHMYTSKLVSGRCAYNNRNISMLNYNLLVVCTEM